MGSAGDRSERFRPWLRDARRWTEPWHWACVLLGATSTDIVPILVPTEVADVNGWAVYLGFVLPAMGVGMLSAPIRERLADRLPRVRQIVAGGALAVAFALVGFSISTAVVAWVWTALLTGSGIAAACTMSRFWSSPVSGRRTSKLGSAGSKPSSQWASWSA